MGDHHTEETVNIRARFEAGLLPAMEVDRRFPSPEECRGLRLYRANRSGRGGKAARASFDGSGAPIELDPSDSTAMQFDTVQVVQSASWFLPQKVMPGLSA
jgi:hypothetical protein